MILKFSELMKNNEFRKKFEFEVANAVEKQIISNNDDINVGEEDEPKPPTTSDDNEKPKELDEDKKPTDEDKLEYKPEEKTTEDVKKIDEENKIKKENKKEKSYGEILNG